MKIILHIGSGRTGTQALQHFLKLNVSILEANGIAYPILNKKNHHNPLALPLCCKNTPRYLANIYGTDFAKNIEYFHEYFDELQSVLKTSKSNCAILSSEFLSLAFAPKDGKILFNKLWDLATRIEVVLYLRNPADYYLSAALQTLKASGNLKPPSHQPIKTILSGYEELQAQKLHIREYSRDALVGRDVCRDFMTLVSPEIVEKCTYFEADRNETLSAEVMSIIQDYRRLAWPNDNNKFNDETDKLVDMAAGYARANGLYRKPQLRPGLRYSLNQANADLAWLAERYSFRFDSVKYNDPKPLSLKKIYRNVEDICIIDQRARHEILVAVMTKIYANAEARAVKQGNQPTQLSEFTPLKIVNVELKRLSSVVDLTRKPEFEVWHTKAHNDLIESGRVLIRKNFPTLHLSNPVDWDVNPLNDKTWQLYYYSLGWLSGFTFSTPSADRWAHIIAIVDSACNFIIDHLDDESSALWDDHATAYRASYLAYLYAYGMASKISDVIRAKLFYVMEVHKKKLKSFLDSDKWAQSNHTLFHAEGLADLALVFMTDPERRLETLRFASAKIEVFVKAAVNLREGTVREHALFYHIFLMGRIAETTKYFEAIGAAIQGIGTKEYARLLEFVQLIMPKQGRLPGIGDSKHHDTFDYKYLRDFEAPKYVTGVSRYMMTEGVDGDPNPFLAEFVEDGYFIFRSSFGDRQLFSVLLHKPYKGPHGHWDGGSFITYYDGIPMLIDSGGPYKYSDVMRYHYFQTPLAHNCLIFDDLPISYTTHLLGIRAIGDLAFVGLAANFGRGRGWIRFFGQIANIAHVIVDIPNAVCTESEARIRYHLDPNAKVLRDYNNYDVRNQSVHMHMTTMELDLPESVTKRLQLLTNKLTNEAEEMYKGPAARQVEQLPKDFRRRSFVTLKDNELVESKMIERSVSINKAHISIMSFDDTLDLRADANNDELSLVVNSTTRLPARICIDLSNLSPGSEKPPIEIIPISGVGE